MTNDVRCLFNPGREIPRPGNGAPRGAGRAAHDARINLEEFLDANLQRPLTLSNSDRSKQLEQSLDTMTQAERVWLEIEMQSQTPATYSVDYDALPNR